MAKFYVDLRRLILKLSIKYLLFIILIIIGCSYQVIQVTKVFLKFETKVDVKYEQNNEIVIPMVSFCKETSEMFRNSSKRSSQGLSPAQLYNQTFSFDEVFISIEFIKPNGKFGEIFNFTDEQQNNSEVYYEKTISNLMICYHIKYLHSKQLKHKQGLIYPFYLYHHNYETSKSIINNYPYQLFVTSNINYPYDADNSLFIFGNNFFL